MTTFDKITNIAGAVLFGVLGLMALIGALFFGATHHFVTAAIGAIMAWALWAEIKRERKNNQRGSCATQ